MVLNYHFQRECRTPFSESYNIMEEQKSLGRLDLHFTPNVVHASLCVSESLTQEAIQELIDTIDAELVDILGISREEFIVHVYQGRETGVYSNPEFGQNGDA